MAKFAPAAFEERFHEPDGRPPGDVRHPYERDRARVVHSAAFRRLQGKTQVMGVGEGDFHRTRLTHSIECAQIGAGLLEQLQRDGNIPKALEPWTPSRPLIEAACLAHDLGHPPFGHGGEVALQRTMRTGGGFEGNGHTLRLLARLEKAKQLGWGINPTRRLTLAVLKYPIPYSAFEVSPPGAKPPKCYFDEESGVVGWALAGFGARDREALGELDGKRKARHRTFDCSLMELADDIAYGVHDIEDIVARKLANREEVHAALADVFHAVGGRLETPRATWDARCIGEGLFGSSFERKQVVSALVGTFITAVIVKRRERFEHPLLEHRAALPEEHCKVLDGIRGMSFDLVIRKARVRQLERRGMHIVSEIFRALQEEPEQLIPADSWRDGDPAASVDRRICDYIAGMTDGYAERVYRRLFIPGFGSSGDEL